MTTETLAGSEAVAEAVHRRAWRSSPYVAYGGVTLLVLVAALVATPLLGWPPAYPMDDAYITLHNAQVLHDGADENFVGTPAVAGATSLVHLALVASLLPLLGAASSYVVAWIGALLYALGIVHLCRALRLGPLSTAGIVALGMTAGLMAYQLLNGLETPYVLAAAAWLLALSLGRRNELALGAVSGLAVFVRPELGALVGPLLVYRAWRLYRDGDLRRLLPLIGAGVAAALPFLIWSLVALGSVLPSTVTAKRAWFADGSLPRDVKIEFFTDSAKLFLVDIGLLALAALLLVRSAIGRICLLFGGVFYLAYYLAFPGVLSHYGGRYQYVLVPLLLFGLASWLASRRRWQRATAAVLTVGALGYAVLQVPEHTRVLTATNGFTRNELEPVARWVQQNTPADARLMIHDAGYIAYATDRRLVDVVGLKTPSAVPFNERFTLPSGGGKRARALDGFARAERPDYLVVLDGWDRAFNISKGLRSRGWTLTRMYDEAYDVYQLTPPPGA